MTRSVWGDPTQRPDLSRLPSHLRHASNAPMPLREHEVHGKIYFFFNRALNFPNGRVHAALLRDPEGKTPPAVQVDLADFTGRQAVASIVLAPSAVREVICSLAQAYEKAGGDKAALMQALTLETGVKKKGMNDE